MTYDLIISSEEYKQSQENTTDIDMDAFHDVRDEAPLRELVEEMVRAQYLHPSGPEDIPELKQSARMLVFQRVKTVLLPDEVPEEVVTMFADGLASDVEEYTVELYKSVREEEDPADLESKLPEIENMIHSHAKEIVPESY